MDAKGDLRISALKICVKMISNTNLIKMDAKKNISRPFWWWVERTFSPDLSWRLHGLYCRPSTPRLLDASNLRRCCCEAVHIRDSFRLCSLHLRNREVF